MKDNYIQNIIADNIGGSGYGKDNAIYKFEKIKRAKCSVLEANPGVEIIDMGVGEPDGMAHTSVVKVLAYEAAMWENRQYTDNGIVEFKLAAARYMRSVYGVDLNYLTEINHAVGTKSALSLIPAAYINPGDITIMTIPGYPVLGTWTKYLGGEVVNLELREENSFLPELDLLTTEQKKRAKLLYLNYPNNPTGAVATENFFKTVIKFAQENNILIVSDAAYAPLNFQGNPLSILAVPGGKNCAIELHTMSKGFNMTGWRMAWVCGNALAVNAFAYVKDNADSGQFAAIQKASIAALDNWQSITIGISVKYERRLKKLVSILKECGFSVKMPAGGFYLYVKIPKAVKNGPVFKTAEDFSQWLIKEKFISTVPWDDVGHYVRFSVTFVAKNGLRNEEKLLNEVKNRLKSSIFVF